MTINCPLCNQASQPAFEKDGYPIQDCIACGHRFAGIDLSQDHVTKVYGDDYFTGGGAGYDDYTTESDLLIAHGEYYGNLINQYTTAGTVLDVGSAAGFILQGLTNTGWSGSGIEPNQSMAQYARDTMGLDVQVGSFEDTDVQDKVDLVTMIQVAAHFYDFNKAVDTAYKVLKPNGYLLIETWDFKSAFARMFGTNWHEYSPPSVVHWFSESTLTAHLAQRGYEKITTSKPSKYIKTGHAKSLLEYKLASSKLGQLLYQPLRLIPDDIKVPYPSFDLFWALYQRQ